jgi:AAT family amino acid transporter
MASSGALRPRWGQPVTGIVSFFVFFFVAWFIWYIFSDPRGPVGSFPYPFVLYLAMMILVGLWQHMFLGDWPFHKLSQPTRGIVETIFNLILVWFVIHVVFYRILGLGFNFLSESNLEWLAATGKTMMPEGVAKTLTLQTLINPAAHFGERAVVTFVLIGFFSYPYTTILFGKWPIRPSDLKQPEAGLAELGWCSMLTMFYFTILIVPFWGLIYGVLFGKSYGLGLPWWSAIAGTPHVHWVFGWWEWAIIVLFMTPNVWRMKPWSVIKLPQPWKGFISLVLTFILGYILALLCVKLAPTWLNMEEVIKHLPAGDKGNPTRFLWYHAAEIAGFTLIPFLIWHHYFDDLAPGADVDSWGNFWFRTIGVGVLMVLNYFFYYYINFGHWGLGIHHMAHGFAERVIGGESLIWNFWWIIPLLWNEWFFHKWPFYVHEH